MLLSTLWDRFIQVRINLFWINLQCSIAWFRNISETFFKRILHWYKAMNYFIVLLLRINSFGCLPVMFRLKDINIYFMSCHLITISCSEIVSSFFNSAISYYRFTSRASFVGCINNGLIVTQTQTKNHESNICYFATVKMPVSWPWPF